MNPFVRTMSITLLTIVLGVLLVCSLVFAPRLVTETLREKPLSTSQYSQTVQRYLVNLTQRNIAAGANDKIVWSSLVDSSRRSLELLVITLFCIFPIGIVWGAIMASMRYHPLHDFLLSLNTLLNALPSFLLLLLAMGIVANYNLRTGRQLAFVQGYGLDRHLILPVLSLSIRGSAFVALRLYIAQIDILDQDWIRGARAKGIGGIILWRNHIVPALRLPLIGISLSLLRVVIAGLVIVDVLYGWGGLGQRMLIVNPFSARPAANATAVGAGIILFIVFLLCDILGRIGTRYAEPRLRSGI